MSLKSALILLLLVAALIGFVDATYLAVKHYRGGEVVCEIGGTTFGSCESVLESSYATIAGVPVSLVGALYYLVAFLLVAGFSVTNNLRILQLAALLTGFGFLATLWFVYLQLFILDTICLYCMVSAASTALLFVGSVTLLGQSARPAQNLSR